MEKVILFGNGPAACSVYATLKLDPQYQIVAFTVDKNYIQEETLFDLPVVPFENIEVVNPPSDNRMLVSLGYKQVNRLRAEKYLQAKDKGYRLINTISDSASIHPYTLIGDNCIVGQNVIIDPFVEIGNNVSINNSVIIGHHTVIKDHCFLAPGVIINGGVTIEPYCFLGAGAIIRDRIIIGAECVVSAGAIILEDTAARGVYLAGQANRLSIQSDQLSLA